MYDGMWQKQKENSRWEQSLIREKNDIVIGQKWRELDTLDMENKTNNLSQAL